MFPRASGSTSSGAVVLALALGLSSLHTQILPVQTEWPGRVQLGPYDRVGFVRLRKVGSTAVHLHLERVLKMCVSHCLGPDKQCKSCMYSTSGCTCTNRTELRRYAEATCYPCGHYSPEYVEGMFKPLEYGYALPLVDHGAAADAASAVRMQAKLQSRDRGPPRGPADMIRHTLKDIGGQTLLTKQALPQQLIAKKKLRLAARGSVDDADDVDKLTGLSSAVSAGKRLPYLYWVTVLRDPVDRIFSEFFFLRPACGLRNTRTLVGLGNWLDSYPPSVKNAVCANDLYTFGTLPESPAVDQQTRQLGNVGIGWDDHPRPPLTSKDLRKAFDWLRNMDVVLVQEELYPAGMAMLDFVFGFGVEGIGDSIAAIFAKARVGAPEHELHGAGDGSEDLPAPDFLDEAERDGGGGGGGGGGDGDAAERQPAEKQPSLRTLFKANKTLCAAIRQANSYDLLLHSEAKRIFNFNKAAMLAL